MRECLIMSTHTKYEHFKYNDVKEIPNAWLKKHIRTYIKDGGEEFPKSCFENIPLIGYRYYKVYNCAKGILQYYNNEVGFFYNTGSYMYIRFLYHNDCEEYIKLLLKDYNIEFKQNFYANKYNFNCGDIITFKTAIPLDLDTEFYEDMYGLPHGSTQLEYFDKTKDKLKEGEQEENHNYFQVQTIYEDKDGIFIIPAFIPDVTQFRLKGVPGLPYCTVGPQNMAIEEKYLHQYKNFEDDSKEIK